jgi:phage-related protein
MEGMTTASGDLERTQASFSNQVRELQGRIVNWATDMGTKALPAANSLLSGILAFPAAFQSATGWIDQHSTGLGIAAGIITAVFLPAMIRSGVTATVSGAQVVASFVAQRVAAVASAAAQWAALVRVIAGWVAAGAAAVASGAQTVAIWAMYQAQAIQGAAATVAAHARIVAAWVASGAAAVAGAARTAAAWALSVAQAVAGGVVMVASMAATAASVVAGWVLMGVQSMIHAARMAAAWFIALGPVGWVIAAVIGLVALIIANWDTVSRVTAQVWKAIVGWVKEAWQTIVQWVTQQVERVKSVIDVVFRAIQIAIQMYVNAWRTVIQAVWSAIVAVVTTYVNMVQAVIGGLAAIGSRVAAWFGQARDGAANALSSLVEFVRGVPGRIMDALGNVGRILFNAGASIMQGLTDGIRSAVGKVTGAVGDVMQAARNLLPFSPAKEGPFSGKGWTLYSGMSIANALADGIRRRTGQVGSAAMGMAQAAAVPIRAGAIGLAGPAGGGGSARAAGPSLAALGVAGAAGGGPSTLVIVDKDGDLIGRMQVEAGRVATGRVTPLHQGRAAW